jgi:hypothetical protein
MRDTRNARAVKSRRKGSRPRRPSARMMIRRVRLPVRRLALLLLVHLLLPLTLVCLQCRTTRVGNRNPRGNRRRVARKREGIGTTRNINSSIKLLLTFLLILHINISKRHKKSNIMQALHISDSIQAHWISNSISNTPTPTAATAISRFERTSVTVSRLSRCSRATTVQRWHQRW